MAGVARKLFFYIVQYQCHSMKPPKAIQQIASEKATAGVDLVADARAMLAAEFKRDSDEIEILGIRGQSDPTQVWPAPAATSVEAENVSGDVGNTGSVSQGEGANGESPQWTPETPPPTAFPTVEEAGALVKADMFKLAERLELEIAKNPEAKFPAVRAAVLAELSKRQAGQPAA